jgi:excisionase family DNA binding protein
MKKAKSVPKKNGRSDARRPEANATHQTILELATLVAHFARRVLDENPAQGATTTAAPAPAPASAPPARATAQSVSMTSDDNLTVSEVAAILRITEPTVREHIKAHRLEATRPRRTYLVKRSAVEKFMSGAVHADEDRIKKHFQSALSRLGA